MKGHLLIGLHTIRSDRQFREQLEYTLLFRWFLGMSLDEPPFDHSTFSANRDRMLTQKWSAGVSGGVKSMVD